MQNCKTKGRLIPPFGIPAWNEKLPVGEWTFLFGLQRIRSRGAQDAACLGLDRDKEKKKGPKSDTEFPIVQLARFHHQLTMKRYCSTRALVIVCIHALVP
jgi:hypothetical protein